MFAVLRWLEMDGPFECAGDTNLVGGVPPQWVNMSSLSALDVSNACGVCGGLPAFPQGSVGQLQVTVPSPHQ